MAEEKQKLEVPNPPEHAGALAEIPDEIVEKWKKVYAETYGASGDDDQGDDSTRKAAALREANRLIRVKTPKSYEDAAAIPDWQLMLKEEVNYDSLPKHAKDEVKAAKGRKSGAYLRVYTTDGKEHFFPKPEAKASKESKGKDEGKGGSAAA